MSTESNSGNTEERLDRSSIITLIVIVVIVIALFTILIYDTIVNASKPNNVPVKTSSVDYIGSNSNITAWIDRKDNLLLLRSPARSNFYYELLVITDPEKRSGFLLGVITNDSAATNLEFRVSADIFKQIKYPNFHILEKPVGVTNVESSVP